MVDFKKNLTVIMVLLYVCLFGLVSEAAPMYQIAAENDTVACDSLQQQEEVFIPENTKRKLDHYLHIALLAYKQFTRCIESGEPEAIARERLRDELRPLSSGIVIHYDADEPTVEVLIKVSKYSSILHSDLILDAMVHTGVEYDFITGTIYLRDLETLTGFDSVLGIEASRILR